MSPAAASATRAWTSERIGGRDGDRTCHPLDVDKVASRQVLDFIWSTVRPCPHLFTLQRIVSGHQTGSGRMKRTLRERDNVFRRSYLQLGVEAFDNRLSV